MWWRTTNWQSSIGYAVTYRSPMSAARMTAMPGQAPAARWTPVVGGFTTARLLPGRYWVAVVPDANAMPPTDRESLDKLRATATSVTVTTGEPATVQLRLPK